MSKEPMDVLYDSAAALRLVDSALREIAGIELDEAPAMEQSAPTATVNASSDTKDGVLQKSYQELRSVLATLRNSRQLVDGVARSRLQATNLKLREVSAATESAAVVIIHGLERAVSLIGELEVPGHADDRRAAVRATLRDELYTAISHMQFQDITSQQLSHSAAILNDIDNRIAAVVDLLEPEQRGSASSIVPDPATYDPAAILGRSDERQALVDQVVAARRASD